MAKKKGPIQTRHQQKEDQNNGVDTTPSKTVTRQTRQRQATVLPTVNGNEDDSPSLPIGSSLGEPDKQPNNRRQKGKGKDNSPLEQSKVITDL